MPPLIEVPISLEPKQARRLIKGHRVQLSPHHVAGSSHPLLLHSSNARKIHRAKRHQRGCRILLSHPEIEANGGSIIDWLRNAANWVKTKVIDTPFYQSTIRPIAKQLVQTGVSALPLGPVAKDVAQKAANYVGEQSAAFGIKHRKKRGRYHAIRNIAPEHRYHEVARRHRELLPLEPLEYVPRDNSNLFILRPDAPGMFPKVNPMSLACAKAQYEAGVQGTGGCACGGSFRPAGGSFRTAGSGSRHLSTPHSDRRVAALRRQGYEIKEVETPEGVMVLKRKHPGRRRAGAMPMRDARGRFVRS